MMQTISVSLDNRFGEVERILGLLFSAGFKVKKMVLSESGTENLSDFVVVVETNDKNVKNILIRIEQLIRVKSVHCVEGDHLAAAEYLTTV